MWNALGENRVLYGGKRVIHLKEGNNKGITERKG